MHRGYSLRSLGFLAEAQRRKGLLFATLMVDCTQRDGETEGIKCVVDSLRSCFCTERHRDTAIW